MSNESDELFWQKNGPAFGKDSIIKKVDLKVSKKLLCFLGDKLTQKILSSELGGDQLIGLKINGFINVPSISQLTDSGMNNFGIIPAIGMFRSEHIKLLFTNDYIVAISRDFLGNPIRLSAFKLTTLESFDSRIFHSPWQTMTFHFSDDNKLIVLTSSAIINPAKKIIAYLEDMKLADI